MIIKAPHNSDKFTGGGSVFLNNLTKALKKYGHQVVNDNSDYDILFITGATLVDRSWVDQASGYGKPIILRVDNILEDRKNRSAGMTRLLDYAKKATVIVYQSEWAKRLLEPLLGKGIVIPNGVDTDIFYPRKEEKTWDNNRIFYSKWSRNEVKQFHEVQYWWREYNLISQDDTLVLVGKYADDYLKIAHPFDFHNEEAYDYKGVITDNKKLADIMRSCDVAFLPYMFDACSNTQIECQATGLPIIYSNTGGGPEIIENGVKINYDITPVEMVKQALDNNKNFDVNTYREKYGLQSMGEKYNALFLTICGNQFEI